MKQATYLQYQEQIAASKVFRYFWQFWSNYAFVFFAAAALLALGSDKLFEYSKPVFVLSILAFLLTRGFFIAIINLIYERSRPYQRYDFEPITSNFFSFKTHMRNSFPSRHTATYFTVATTFIIFYPGLGACLMFVGLMAGGARVVMGYHWPSDIVVGAILGIIVGYLTFYIGYPLLFT